MFSETIPGKLQANLESLGKREFIKQLRSLTYFEDAEKDDMPHMLTQVSWEEVKRYLENETKNFLKNS